MNELKEIQLAFLQRQLSQRPPPNLTPANPPSRSRNFATLAPRTSVDGGSNAFLSTPVVKKEKKSKNELSTTGRYLFTVIEFLREADQAVTAEDIYNQTQINIRDNEELLTAIQNNPKVVITDQKWFSYKPTFDVTTKSEVLQLINSTDKGIDSNDLKDAYKTVMEDIFALRDSGKIRTILNQDTKALILFPQTESHLRVNLFPEFKEMWKKITIPDAVDLEKELRKAGFTPIPENDDVVGNRYKKKTNKRRKRRRRIKITNTHVKGINFFDDDYQQPQK